VLPAASDEKVGTKGENFIFYFCFITCRVILHNNSQKQNDTLNSTHEN